MRTPTQHSSGSALTPEPATCSSRRTSRSSRVLPSASDFCFTLTVTASCFVSSASPTGTAPGGTTA
uniref:Uncharacterized protein n=1 Tax=Macrostomum lignano TaxID=282301 RepID=A0A1I8FWL3_9PLAT